MTDKPIPHEHACSSCGRECVVLPLTIPAYLSYTSKERIKDCSIDACIAPIVKALNDGGIITIACCCGHKRGPGSIVLSDGRELIVAADFKSARRIDDLFKTTVYGEPRQQLQQRRGLRDVVAHWFTNW